MIAATGDVRRLINKLDPAVLDDHGPVAARRRGGGPVNPDAVRVVTADDRPIIRDGLAALLTAIDGALRRTLDNLDRRLPR